MTRPPRPPAPFRRPAHSRRLRALAALCLVSCNAFIAGCGGGLMAGVGSGGSGVAEGTLSGFGSVIVDGIEYSEEALAADARSTLRLGQRVRLVFGADGVARSIEVLAQLRGPVTATLDANGWLRLAGQWVRVVDDSEDSTRSGITLLDGFDAGAVLAGQDAVAYGSWVWDDSKAAYVLVATRIEKLAAQADPVLMGGIATAAGGAGLRLNAADGTTVTAARLPAVREGAVVAVQVPRADVVAAQTAQGTVGSVQAQDVRDASLGALDLAPYQTVRLGGLAEGYDGNAGTVSIQGTRLMLGAGAAPVGERQFVRATAGAGLNAATVQPRFGSPVGMPGDDGTGAVTQLKGLLSGVNWNLASIEFVLRGVPVRANAAQVDNTCRSAPSGQTLYVQVNGYTPSPTAPVRANAVICSTDLSAAQDM